MGASRTVVEETAPVIAPGRPEQVPGGSPWEASVQRKCPWACLPDGASAFSTQRPWRQTPQPATSRPGRTNWGGCPRRGEAGRMDPHLRRRGKDGACRFIIIISRAGPWGAGCLLCGLSFCSGCWRPRRGPAGAEAEGEEGAGAEGCRGEGGGERGGGAQARTEWLPDPQADGSNLRSRGAGLNCWPARGGPTAASRKQPHSHMFKARCSACLCLFKDAGAGDSVSEEGAEADAFWALLGGGPRLSSLPPGSLGFRWPGRGAAGVPGAFTCALLFAPSPIRRSRNYPRFVGLRKWRS